VRLASADTVLATVLGAGAFGVILAETTSTVFELDRFAVPKELVLNVAALLAVPLLATGRQRIVATVPEALLGCFVLWSALCALLATNHWIALRAFALTLSGFILFLSARQVAGTAGRRDVLLRVLALATIVAALTGMLQAWGIELPGLAAERAPGGTFGNRNFLAHFTVIGAPLVALAALVARRKWSVRLWLAGLVVCSDAVVLTRSRAGWLGLATVAAVAGLAVVLHRRLLVPERNVRRRLTSIVAALATGMVAALVLPNALEWRSDSPYADTLNRLTDYRGGSGRGRLIQYRNTLGLVRRNPVFGSGPGNWFIDYPLVTSPGDPSYAPADPIPTNPWPSSDWVALLAERSGVGVSIVVLAGIAIAIIALRRLRAADPVAAFDALALLCVLAATTVTGLFDAVMLNAAPTLLTAVAVGLLLPASRPIIDMPSRRRGHTAVVALILALTLAAVLRSGEQLAAIRIVEDGNGSAAAMNRALAVDPPNYRLQLRLALRGRCATRLPHARAAARLMPHHEMPARALAECD